ncbi:hypothetical protein [Roseateles sp.]|uniref:hypothetical protein n=1 Tax=Roseateles sp. TaxID=1971397 RepID=UPI0039E8423E
MPDYTLANSLAAEALNLWGDKLFEAAADRYRRAIAIVPEDAGWHGAYAGVLQSLGRHDEAAREYETALSLELAQGRAEVSPRVKVARYFLADHFTRFGAASKALDVLGPAVTAFPDDWLVGSVHALALFAAGRPFEAKVAAERAIANVDWEPKRSDLVQRLQEVLAAGDG